MAAPLLNINDPFDFAYSFIQKPEFSPTNFTEPEFDALYKNQKNPNPQMNFPPTLKSPRSEHPMTKSSTNIGDPLSLQQSVLQKQQIISTLQASISRLELKNKQLSTCESAMVELEERLEETAGELIKCREKLRAQGLECEELKRKYELELADKKKKASSFVKHEDFAKLSAEFKAYRELHKNADAVIKELEKKLVAQASDNEAKVQQLNKEIANLHDTITRKDCQLNDLKLQKYNMKSSIIIEPCSAPSHSLKPLLSPTVISSFRNIGEESTHSSGVLGSEVDKLNYELVMESRETDELRSRVRALEQELQMWMERASELEKNNRERELMKIIQDYEANATVMAGKLQAVHRLEMEKSSVEQDRRRLEIKLEQLTQEFNKRTVYCQDMERKLREVEAYKGISMESDIGAFVARNQALSKEVERLMVVLGSKQQVITELRKKFQELQISQETIRLMQQYLDQFEQKYNKLRAESSKAQDKIAEEEEKYFKLQKQYRKLEIELNEIRSQMGKANRLTSQKMQKIEFQSIEIKRLEKQNAEKKELSEKLAKLEIQYKKMEKKCDEQLDESNELAMSVMILSAQIQRREMTGNITKQFMLQFESLKNRSKQTQAYSASLEQRVKRLEQLHRQVVVESKKVSEQLRESHKRWNHYDAAMDKLVQFLEESNAKNQQRYEEMDKNINTWLEQQQQRLRDLEKMEALGSDSKQQFIVISSTSHVVPSAELK